jgi:hypothetical protein
MRLILALTLIALPTALSAQIAPRSPSDTPPGPVSVRIEPSTIGDYQRREARERIHEGRKSATLTKSLGARPAQGSQSK